MGQMLGLDNIPLIVVASNTSLTLAATFNNAPTRITIGGQQYSLSSGLTLNTGSVGLNGIDTGSIASNTLYSIYAVVSSGVVGLVISTSATAPSGFTQYALIGRVRTYQGSSNLAFSSTLQNGRLVLGQNPSGVSTYLPTVGGLGAGGITTISTGSAITYYLQNQYVVLNGCITKDGSSGSGGADFTITLPFSNANIDVSQLASTGSINAQSNGVGRFNLVSSSPKSGVVYPSNTGLLRFRRTDSTNAELNGADILANNNLNIGPLFVPLVELAGLLT